MVGEAVGLDHQAAVDEEVDEEVDAIERDLLQERDAERSQFDREQGLDAGPVSARQRDRTEALRSARVEQALRRVEGEEAGRHRGFEGHDDLRVRAAAGDLREGAFDGDPPRGSSALAPNAMSVQCSSSSSVVRSGVSGSSAGTSARFVRSRAAFTGSETWTAATEHVQIP